MNFTLLALAVTAFAPLFAAEPPGVKAPLLSENARKPAHEFALQDASGRTLTLANYRGKVVLLDFWATWCHGCKTEIPWFAQFEKTYGGKSFEVVGISLDDGGWKVVKPFLDHAAIPYPILLGNSATADSYGISAMPDTYLIDRQGRVAAIYIGLVDRENVEANIKALLSSQ